MSIKRLEAAPIKTYDDSIWNQFEMYDNMPYVWNSDLSSEMILALESGNIIKAYRCIVKDPYEIKN